MDPLDHSVLRRGAAPGSEVLPAHAGALLLDELPEFPVRVLETLREPLEEGAVTISRAGSVATYEVYCSVAGHKEAGMVGKLIVT